MASSLGDERDQVLVDVEPVDGDDLGGTHGVFVVADEKRGSADFVDGIFRGDVFVVLRASAVAVDLGGEVLVHLPRAVVVEVAVEVGDVIEVVVNDFAEQRVVDMGLDYVLEAPADILAQQSPLPMLLQLKGDFADVEGSAYPAKSGYLTLVSFHPDVLGRVVGARRDSTEKQLGAGVAALHLVDYLLQVLCLVLVHEVVGGQLGIAEASPVDDNNPELFVVGHCDELGDVVGLQLPGGPQVENDHRVVFGQ